MTNDRSHRKPISSAEMKFDPPCLTFIGEAAEVILGVAAAGDDMFGYTPPEFEFEPDGDGL